MINIKNPVINDKKVFFMKASYFQRIKRLAPKSVSEWYIKSSSGT